MVSDDEVFFFRTEYDDEPVCEQTVNEVLQSRAEVLDDEPLIHYGPPQREVSYAEANATANAIGNSLHDLGITEGDRVSVLLQDPLQTVLGFFGILRAGAIYSPINAEYKADPLAYQLNDTDPDLLLIDDQFAGRIEAIRDDLDTDPHVVIRHNGGGISDLDCFESSTFDTLLDGDSKAVPDVDRSWRDEASIIYTSGTTGNPKGCVCSHRYWLGGICMVFGQILEEDDVVHNSLPMYHIAGVGQVLIPMVAGAACSLWQQFSPTEFWDRVDRYESTHTILLSVMIPWLVKPPEQPDDDENTIKMTIMQPVPDNWQAIANRFGFEVVPMMYSQTEASVPLSGFVHAEGGKPDDWIKGVHPDDIVEKVEGLNMPMLDEIPGDRFMGRPISSVAEGKIVDTETGEELPPGNVGELVLRPKQEHVFMEEYYGMPDKTAETFRDGWLHTGDAAYRDEDGNYFFVDRLGDVIRRRGENISSLQIQDAVNSHAEVEQAAVFPVPAPEGGEDQIGCAVQLAEDSTLDRAGLEAYLSDRLPEFMIPDRVTFFDVLPTTETGKIEKYKLREQFADTDTPRAEDD